MIEVAVTVLVLIIVVGLCLHHHHLKIQLLESIEDERAVIKLAAAHSIVASNTVNPISAVSEVSSAERLIKFLHEKYGPHEVGRRTGIDTKQLLDKLTQQRQSILKNILQTYPDLVPHHPLNQMVHG